MKRLRLVSPFLILALLVVALSAGPLRTNYAALDQDPPAEPPPVMTCPTGSLVAFSKPTEPSVASDAGKIRVYVRREDSFDKQVWQVGAQQVDLPSVSSDQKSEVGIGFVVPQLSRGRYLAWYGALAPAQATDSLTFDAVPLLLAEQGITRGSPLSEVNVQVRIAAITRLRLGSSTPESVSVPVTLQVPDASLAEVVGDRTVRTDDNGVARWRVRIKKLGIGQLIASAEQFEPTVMAVVGMPGPGDAFWQAQLTALQQRARELNVPDKPDELVIAGVNPPTTTVIPGDRSGVAASVGEKVARSTARPRPQSAVKLEAERALAAAEEWAKNSEREPRRLAEWELQPGDVLLVLGSSFFSDSIRKFEQRQLGVQAGYSHASLYLGEFGGVKMVGEMWGKGFWITPLAVSVAGTILVDVYRSPQADLARRTELARKAANAFGDAKLFIRSDSPSFFSRGSVLAYAFEQIGLLGLASSDSLAATIKTTLQTIVDPRAGGKRKMICSEYVAWAYHDAGLELEVPAWKSLSNLKLLDTHERQHDYTTPNMLALSKSLSLVGRYRGP
jgi:hypothetical protein